MWYVQWHIFFCTQPQWVWNEAIKMWPAIIQGVWILGYLFGKYRHFPLFFTISKDGWVKGSFVVRCPGLLCHFLNKLRKQKVWSWLPSAEFAFSSCSVALSVCGPAWRWRASLQLKNKNIKLTVAPQRPWRAQKDTWKYIIAELFLW